MGKAPAVCAEIWLVTSRKLSTAGFCVWVGLVQLGFVVKLPLGLVIPTKMNGFAMGNIHGLHT